MDVRTGFADVEGARLYYEAAGAGSSVVFIHPGLWDGRTWDDQFELFAGRYAVVRYDVRGYGRSDRPSAPYSHMDDLAHLMSSMEIDRAAVIGCSIGGGIAIDFALEHPEKVWALVPVAPGLHGIDYPDEKWEPIWAPVQAAIDAGDVERVTELGLEIWAPLGTADETGRRIREIALDNRHAALLDENLERRPTPAAIERLEEIQVPTLVVLGAQDVDEINQGGELIATRVPGARKVVIEGADHVVNMRKPEEFNRVVLEFLASLA